MPKGFITQLLPKESNGKKFWAVCIDMEGEEEDQWFTSWLNMRNFEVGDFVEFTFTEKIISGETYRNIKNIKRVEEEKKTEEQTKRSEEIAQNREKKERERQDLILKQVALKAAAQMYAQMPNTDAVIEAAEKFLKWLREDGSDENGDSAEQQSDKE